MTKGEATISIVVAIARNGVIGRHNGLPWRLSTDMKRFKAITMGKPVVMGRKTYESIGRPLPGRINIVISHNASFVADGIATVASIDEALSRATAQAVASGRGEVCVIGGGEIYRLALPYADRLYVTEVETTVEGDTTFPEIDNKRFRPVSEERLPAGERDRYATRHVVYERLSS